MAPISDIFAFRLLRLQRLYHDLRDILHFHLLLCLHALEAIIEHSDAERASGGEYFGTGVEGFRHPRLVDALADLLLHPGATAAAAAAEALVAVAAHLCHTVAIQHG